MNKNEKTKKLKTMLILLAEYYGEQPTEARLELFTQDLIQFDLNDIKKAIDVYRLDYNNKKMPLPAQLIQIINGVFIDNKTEATLIANNIIAAINKYGYYWDEGLFINGQTTFQVHKEGKTFYFKTFKEALLCEFGEIGALIVQKIGWKNLCIDDSDKTFRIAQLRDLVSYFLAKNQRNQSLNLIANNKTLMLEKK
jgi:hypothetical protein